MLAPTLAPAVGVALNSLGLPKPPAETRVVVAMSGGVDSSVVAAMLAAEGYDVVGLTMQLYDHGEATHRKGACCAGQDIQQYVNEYSNKKQNAIALYNAITRNCSLPPTWAAPATSPPTTHSRLARTTQTVALHISRRRPTLLSAATTPEPRFPRRACAATRSMAPDTGTWI